MEGFNLKKFFSVFFLCMGLFCITAFADTLPNKYSDLSSYVNSNYEDIVDKFGTNKLYFCYGNYKTGSENKPMVFISDSPFVIDSSGQLKMNRYYQITLDYKTFYEGSTYVTANYFTDVYLSQSSVEGVENYGSSVLTNIDVNFTMPLVPVVKYQTVAEALQSLMSVFGSQSATILKIGLVILALLLGVSLVPRLIRLFL